ncbi:MAG: ABC transporter ATP-binding protein [Planctomycetota bacterium]
MIAAKHLSRRFGGLLALDDVSFDIGRGEVVGFLGPNGAGKTTAMRILTGYLPATSGSASVAGFDVLSQGLEVRKRIGYLPESVPLYREHRVGEMLAFHARLHRMRRADRRKRIDEVLERVGVKDRERDLIGGLSRGLKQRVALAIALLHDPEVLVLDEPTSGLDPIQRLEVRALLASLAERRTVLLSSHILPEIEASCPRVIVIHRGRIAADGAPADLVAKLSGASFVRVEAVVGPDREKALRLLRSIPGVAEVVDRGRLGIHEVLDLRCDGDLREDVGAIAAQQGWALRELSWRRPSLEQIFSRLTIGREPDPGPPDAPAGAVAPPAPAAAPARKPIYNLNPFERRGGPPGP